jgi:hypothetical protein
MNPVIGGPSSVGAKDFHDRVAGNEEGQGRPANTGCDYGMASGPAHQRPRRTSTALVRFSSGRQGLAIMDAVLE